MQSLGKNTFILGIILVVAGAILWKTGGLLGVLGRLPGDIFIQKGSWRFYFPIATCISGWAMLHHDTAVVPDITIDERIPLEAYLPTFVRSLVMVPVGSPTPVAAIGAYWSHRYEASPGEIAALQALAAQTAAAIQRIGLDDAPWAPTFSKH